MFHRDTLFSIPITHLGDWVFNEQVAKVFPDMVKRSIPSYANMIYMLGILAKQFVKPNSYIYDLGCAMGAVTIYIGRNIQVSGCQIIAVDNSPDMIKYFRSSINKLEINIPIQIIEEDILNISINNTYLVVLNFTLQFVDSKKRLILLRKIWHGLSEGGVLILSEKFSFKNNTINKLFINMHYDFKRANGYSDLEIRQKDKMLKNVMLTDSIETHKSRLIEAGFSHIELWFQCVNFGSLIAFK